MMIGPGKAAVLDCISS